MVSTRPQPYRYPTVLLLLLLPGSVRSFFFPARHSPLSFIPKDENGIHRIHQTISYKHGTNDSGRRTNIVSPLSSSDGDSESLTNSEINRYSRHLVLSEIGMEGQKRLKNSSVLVIGAGGLGSPCLLYLAAAGVGHLGIVDADIVSESNLQRQIIHSTSTVGILKTTSSKDRLEDINPNVQITEYQTEFTSETAGDILNDRHYDVVIDGSDNFPTKYLINDACSIHGMPWIYAAILRFEGQLSVFNYPPGIGPDYRDFLPEPPNPEEIPSCAEGGVVGVLPGVMGILQATEALKMLLKMDAGLCIGRILVYDAMAMKFEEIGLVRRGEGREVVKELIDYQGFCKSGGSTASNSQKVTKPKAESGAPPGRTMDEAEDVALSEDTEEEAFHSIGAKNCLDKLSKGWAPYVLDVRLQTEHEIVALPFTDQVIPHRDVAVNHIPKHGDVLVYCKGGVRGKKACKRLIESGVDGTRLFNMDGGIMGWRKEVDQSMPAY